MYQNFKTIETAAQQCGEMETENHSKKRCESNNVINKIILSFMLVICFSVTSLGQNWKSVLSKIMENADRNYDGAKYRGQLNNESRSGLGVYCWTSGTGSYYFGNWVSGEPSGYGMLMMTAGNTVWHCRDCATYIGNWSSNEKSGEGTCYDKEGNLIYYGNFSNDKPTETYPSTKEYSSYKFKTIEYTSGDKYIGETKNGVRDGYGVYVWSNGNIWFGYWDDGDRKGTGMYLSYNGNWEKQKCNGDNCTTLASSTESNSPRNSNYARNQNRYDSSDENTTTCYSCQGTGKTLCYICSGTGKMMQTQVNYYTRMSYITYITCTFCAGHGGIKCLGCNGKGTVKVSPNPVNPNGYYYNGGDGGYNSGGSSGSSSKIFCKSCGGTGKCTKCGGTGIYIGSSSYTGGQRYVSDCGVCSGKKTCGVCSGRGYFY
jgi:hypothetical protein